MRFIDNIPAVFKNRYFITGTLFLIWISFFDHYNFLFHSELVQQKKELKKELNRLKKETTKIWTEPIKSVDVANEPNRIICL